MKKILVLVEHRHGEIRDITYELLTKGRELAERINGELVALLLGHKVDSFAEKLKSCANRILVIDDERLANFNAKSYQIIISDILKKETPFITLVGHTASGLEIAPSVAVELDIPMTADCIEVDLESGGENLTAIRQVYGGKLNAKISFTPAQQYLLTIRQAVFSAKQGSLNGEIVAIPSSLIAETDDKKFIEYVEAPAGEVDITKADIVVAIGRGVKEKENLPLVEELANTLGGVMACSRPIVDAGWLSKDRQVGSSGKTVKPKLYLAVGISGSFQHITGMKASGTIVAINKDQNAPIFNEADCGIVDDLFKIVPALKEKIKELKQ